MNEIDACYVNSLVDLVNACRENNVKIDKVSILFNGFRVTFKGFHYADAICHDGSYGNPIHARHFEENKYHNDWNECGAWETIGFPWDNHDVSVHDAATLARMIRALNEDDDWARYEKS